MRTFSLFALGGMLTLLSVPVTAQGLRPMQGAERGGAERSTQRPDARPQLDELRARLIERFDTDGDGRLSDAERAEARRTMRERVAGRRGEGRPHVPDRPGARGDVDGGRVEPHRPGLERLRERARELPPHERALLRQRLAERIRAQRGGPEAGRLRSFDRQGARSLAPLRRGSGLRPEQRGPRQLRKQQQLRPRGPRFGDPRGRRGIHEQEPAQRRRRT